MGSIALYDLFIRITLEAFLLRKSSIMPLSTRYLLFSERYDIYDGRIAFNRVVLQDSGMYQCVAENDFGFIYQTVSLHVRGIVLLCL